MIVGSVSSVSTKPPTSGAERGMPKKFRNIARPEQAEHDRRHGREVVDVHLDEVGPAVARRELLEVDGGRNPDGERQQQRHAAACRSSRRQRPSTPACSGSRESPLVKKPRVEASAAGCRCASNCIDPAQLLVVQRAAALRAGRGRSCPSATDRRRRKRGTSAARRCPISAGSASTRCCRSMRRRTADETRTAHARGSARPSASGKLLAQGGPHQRGVVGSGQRLGLALPVRIQRPPDRR